MLALKIVLFTVLVPGSVLGWIPWMMVRSRSAPRVDWSDWASWSGAALVVVGVLAYLHCAWQFGAKGEGTPAPIDPPRKLVANGLYRVTRNPMYLGVITALLGEALLYRSTAVAWYALGMAIGFHVFIVAYEEPKLRRSFGASFTDYKDRVPRWIPRPWRARIRRGSE